MTTLCPGGKERMRRLMAMVASERVDLTPLVTHQFALDDICRGVRPVQPSGDGVLKVALYPGADAPTGRARLEPDAVAV